jgi:drug/metabolite transporter (DMT)-like permease
MNNQKKGVLFALCATLLWSVNFVIATGIKAHSTCRNGFWRWTIACVVLALCHKEQNRNIIKQHIPSLPSRQYGITIFATLIYFAGQTTSAVNLSLIVSIPLFIMVLSRIAFKEK